MNREEIELRASLLVLERLLDRDEPWPIRCAFAIAAGTVFADQWHEIHESMAYQKRQRQD